MTATIQRYRVWLESNSITAFYEGYIDVIAKSEKDAGERAKQKLTGPSGPFSDWNSSMFKIQRVEVKDGKF